MVRKADVIMRPKNSKGRKLKNKNRIETKFKRPNYFGLSKLWRKGTLSHSYCRKKIWTKMDAGGPERARCEQWSIRIHFWPNEFSVL